MTSTPSRESSPSSSPGREARRQGRARGFPLGSKLQLSLSKESLDSGRESPLDLGPSRTGSDAEGPRLDSTPGADTARDGDVTTSVSEIGRGACGGRR